MNQLLLQPSDVLFFRDGRPMGGSLSGHGAAWPLPTVTNAALHAALHRALKDGEIDKIKVHGHDHHRRSGERVTDARLFGSLVTAGPFPVLNNDWLFPRPLDTGPSEEEKSGFSPTLLPLTTGFVRDHSSLPEPLLYPVANTLGPTKKSPANWWNRAAWQSYLGQPVQAPSPACFNDSDFADFESTYGIGIDPETATQDGERFYSAHYLRLRDTGTNPVRLGLLAGALDKVNGDSYHKRDLIEKVFPNSNARTPIIVGGQQRISTVERHTGDPLPLPCGMTTGFHQVEGKQLIKWVLLTPAIFDAIGDHPGGWLPSWIHHQSGEVELLDGPGPNAARRRKVAPGQRIRARLVAALTGKPIPVTGYALPNSADPDRPDGGAKSTHLAVPAGSVYYFEAASPEAAEKLSAALNWHGSETQPITIKNRRSTLFGEKGFGLGVCGTWQQHSGKPPIS